MIVLKLDNTPISGFITNRRFGLDSLHFANQEKFYRESWTPKQAKYNEFDSLTLNVEIISTTIP